MLTGKTAIVTGAAGGVGRATAEVFINNGIQVVMSDSKEDLLKKEADQIGAAWYCADLSNPEGCRSLVDFALQEYGKVGILVNVASVQKISPIEDFPEDQWAFMINLMLNAPFLLTKYVWPSMKESGWGRIIHHNSIHGLVATEYRAAYVSAKHGLSGLTKASALEGAKYGITVNSICSSFVRTPMLEKQIADLAATHQISEQEVISELMLKKAAVKKIHDPLEIGDIIRFLCTDPASGITGALIPVDCGWTAA